jgi:hypothetical protein
MKYILLINLLFGTLISQELECEVKKKAYQGKSSSWVEVCTISDTVLKVSLSTMGSNYHTCNLEGTAIKDGQSFILKEGECVVDLKFSDKTLNVGFQSDCRAFCGMRAWWVSGKHELYIDKDL